MNICIYILITQLMAIQFIMIRFFNLLQYNSII